MNRTDGTFHNVYGLQSRSVIKTLPRPGWLLADLFGSSSSSDAAFGKDFSLDGLARNAAAERKKRSIKVWFSYSARVNYLCNSL